MNNSKLVLQLEIEQLLTDFEKTFRDNGKSGIRKWLEDDSINDLPTLFRELLVCEIGLRPNRSSGALFEEYLVEYPEFQDIVEDVFEAEHAALRHKSKEGIDGADTIGNDNQSATDAENETNWNASPQRRIKHYQLNSLIGEGGMGLVYRGYDEKLGREVAVKLIRHFDSSSEALKRFQMEAITAASLDHPGIVPVYDFGQSENGTSFIVMPLIRGGTFDNLWNRPTDQKQFLEKLATVAESLHFAHESGVIHRDIKPRNILLDRNSEPKICDFGLAKVSDTEGPTITEQVLGTPAYMSPEQLADSGDVGRATDIHALGAILYKILVGRTPYHAESREQCIRRIREEVPQSPREIDRDISRDLETITMKCLEKRPTHRYPSAAELAKDLRRYLDGRPVIARPVSPPVRLARWSMRKPILASLICVTSVLAIVSMASAGMFYRNASQSQEIAAMAEQRRKQESEVSAKERELRKSAEAALVNAKDLTRLAEAHESRASFKSVELAKRLGDFSEANEIATKLQGLGGGPEVTWLKREFEPEIEQGDSISLATWGLYDYDIDQKQQRIVTVDRAGSLIVWSLETEMPLHKLVVADQWEDWGTPFPRWRKLKATEPPVSLEELPGEYFSSVRWKDDSHLWVTAVDGSLFEFDLANEKRKLIWKSDSPLDFIRFNANRSRAIVIDSGGKITARKVSGETTFDVEFGEAISSVSWSRELDMWVVGGHEGKMGLLSAELTLGDSTKMKNRIHDARTWNVNGKTFLFGVAETNSIFQFEISGNSPKLTRRDELQRAKQETNGELRQVVVNPALDQVIASDTKGQITIWNISDGLLQFSFTKMARGSIRPNADDRAAAGLLEKRTRWFLHQTESHLTAIDCTGTLRRFDLTKMTDPVEWRTSTLDLGRKPKLVNQLDSADRFWILNCDGDLMLVSLTDDRVLKKVKAHRGEYADMQLLADGSLVTAGGDQYLKLWRYVDGEIVELRRIEFDRNLLSVAVHEEKDLVASVDQDGKLHVWKWRTGEPIKDLEFFAANEVNAKIYGKKILSGRVAFSKSGMYLAAFGARQHFGVFETDTFQKMPQNRKATAGEGGLEILFSPTIEHRFLESDTLGRHANAISIEGFSADERLNLLHNRSAPAMTDGIALSHDRQRVVSCREGKLGFHTVDHFVTAATLPCPAESGAAVALGAGDTTIALAAPSGKLHWCTLRPFVAAQEETALSGTTHWLLSPESSSPSLLFPNSWHSPIRDAHGNLTTVFYSGSRERTAANRQLKILRKRDSIWRLESLAFVGDDTGPVVESRLTLGPDGNVVAIIRQTQEQVGPYDGRVLLAYESEHPKQWKTEVVHESGNTGFYSHVFFGSKGRVDSLIHFDHGRQRLLLSSRDKAPGEWSEQVLAGRMGVALQGVPSGDGGHRFLMRRLVGWDSIEPTVYAKLSPKSEFSTFPGKGEQPFVLSDQRLVSASNRNRQIYLRKEDGAWVHFATNPVPAPTRWATLLDEDFLAWCFCEDDSVVVQVLDVSAAITAATESGKSIGTEHPAWRTYRVKTKEFLGNAGVSGINVSADGRLQLMLHQFEGDSWLAVVESVEKFSPKQAKGDASGK